MGFFSDIKDSVFGDGGKAAKDAGRVQAAAGREALEFTAEQVAPFRDVGIDAAERLQGAELAGPSFQEFNRDPSRVLNNPLFQALARDQERSLINQQGALGRGGSGETNDLLIQNLLKLGGDFQQQDIQNQQAEFSNQLTENTQRFNQLFNQFQTGANISAGQASTGSGLITDIGAVKAGGIIGQQSGRDQRNENIMGAASAAAMAFSDLRLKDNIKFVETVEGIDLYKWDWSDEAKELVGDQDTLGPIAQILQESNPDLVSVHESGYLKVAA